MLICNNCNSVNEDGSIKCLHCHMEGDFRHQIGENKSDDAPILQSKLICRNCGTNEPGEGSKCVHCRFPLAQLKVMAPAKKAMETSLQASTIHSPAKRP